MRTLRHIVDVAGMDPKRRAILEWRLRRLAVLMRRNLELLIELSPEEVARWLRVVSADSVRAWCKDGRIPCRRVFSADGLQSRFLVPHAVVSQLERERPWGRRGWRISAVVVKE